MRIEDLHVDGFGIVNDLSLGPLPPGLAVIRGDNEAGKTTLLAFVRHILFGFPDGRSNENQYPPLRGGKHGGRIKVVTDSEDPYVIERRPGKGAGNVKLTMPDGRTGDESVLQQLLGFASRELFLNVFAFSLSELQRFESLDDDAVKGAIYSAGMGTGSVSLPEIDSDLDKEMGDIFKPRGRKPVMNELLKELEGVEKDLRQRGDNVEEFDRLHGELEELDERIKSLQRRQKEAQEHRDRAAKLVNAWEDWVELCSCLDELDELPEKESFPAQALERLERAEQQEESVQEALRELEDEKENHEQKLEALDVDESVLEHADRIAALQRGRDQYDSAVREIPRREQELKEARDRLEHDLKELGPEWDVKKLKEFDTSVQQRDTVRDFRNRLRKAESEVTAAQNLPDFQKERGRELLPLWPAWAAGALGLVLGVVLGATVNWIAGAAVAVVLGGGGAAAYLAFRNQQAQLEEREQEQARERLERAQQKLSDVEGEWSEWLNSAGLREDVSPESALELMSLIGQCREQHNTAQGLEERIEQMKEGAEDYRRRAREVAEECGLEPSDEQDAGHLVDTLAERLEQAREDRVARQNLEERLEELERKLEGQGKKLEDVQSRKQDLLDEAGAEDAEEFRRLAETWKRRQELEDEVKDRERALARIAGPGDRVQALKQELDETDRDEQARLKEDAQRELDELNQELEEALDTRGRLREQRESLESEEDSVELRMHRESLLSSLEEHAHRWSVLAVARALLAEAKDRYEKERQPAVIQSASRSFELITEGRYPCIVAPPGEATLDVLDSRENRKSMDDLSRGTREQLYFAVRLGLIREFSQRQEPLPVVMDDVFVNFDPGRARAAMKAVLDLAEDQQVLLFTCHPQTCDLALSEESSTPVFHLEDGEVASVPEETG